MTSRQTLLAVAAVFLLPFVLAWLLNFGPWRWQPEAARNRGALIQPPPRVAASELARPDAEAVAPGAVSRHWTLVYPGAEACGERCVNRLDAMHRTWLALGKDARRVRRWYLAPPEHPPAPGVLARFPGLEVIVEQNPSRPGSLSEALARAAGADPAPGEAVYLLDPRGFVILRYASGHDAADMVDDLERLLRYSAVDR